MAIENTIALFNEDLLPERRDSLFALLKEEVNNLINEDFGKLVQILYRIDVPEKKLRQLLIDNPTIDAADTIAKLIMERQIQKGRLRSRFKPNPDIPEDEKW
ncbi:MAG TPA: hypothetical protein VGD26_11690 [Chitinophagaceae bacterium]